MRINLYQISKCRYCLEQLEQERLKRRQLWADLLKKEKLEQETQSGKEALHKHRINVLIGHLKDTQDKTENSDLTANREIKKPKKEDIKIDISNGNPQKCACGHLCGPSCNCGCDCGCGKANDKKEWKKNKITKQEFFKLKEISDNYEHVRDGIYRLKKGSKPVADNAYYLAWDHLHGDVEVWNKNEVHIGSLDPQALKLYKSPIIGRPFPLE